LRILIVEDSERLSRSLENGLSRLGYNVDSSNDGHTGLNYALTFEYDIIILDIMLPGLDGLSLLREIRTRGRQTKVLILSAKDQIEDRVKGLNLGADDYLIKPFAFEELEARLKTLQRRADLILPSIIDLGKLSIDMNKKTISVDDELMQVTHHEYSILEYLARHRGRIRTSDNICDQIYDSKSDVSRNTIEAHISSLRKKLRCVGVADLIQTRRGFGYIID